MNYYFISFTTYISLITKDDVTFKKKKKNYYSCYSIACKDDDLIATEIHQSVLRICVDLIEFPKKKKIVKLEEGDIKVIIFDRSTTQRTDNLCLAVHHDDHI